MYAQYVKERTDDHILETDQGFATYRFLNERQVYIVDLYIKPDFRKTGIASAFSDTIVDIARAKGCVELLGTVVPSAKNSADSMKVLLAHGMIPFSIEGNMILFKKDIK
jgi:GNAT superfamily N-acetyltransferase